MYLYLPFINTSKEKDILFHTAMTTYKPNFMNHAYQTTNQTNTAKTMTSMCILPLTQSLCSYNWDNANFGVFRFNFQPISKKFIFNQFRTFHPSPLCTSDPEKPVHRSRKSCTWLDEQFRTFHPSLHESVTY